MEIEAVVIMALRHLAMVEIVEEVMDMVIGVDIGITIEALLQDHMVIGIVIEEIVDQEDLLGNVEVHHMVVTGIEIEREEDQEVVVLIIIEGEVDIKLTLEYRKLYRVR